MNFQITQGTGTTIATDTGGGGENYQKIKLIDATPGSTSGTGISSNPFWVTGTVTSNIGTTGGLALDSSIAGIVIGQGSLISGQVGPLIQASTSTLLPSYATGTVNPLSLTLNGLLRVDGSNVIQPVSGTVTAVQSSGSNLHVNIDGFPVTPLSTNLTQVGGSAISLGQMTMASSVPVAFASDQSALPPTKDVAVTGTLSSLVDTVVINCNALSTIGWTTSGTWSGTMIMEVQYGDGQWFLTEVIDTNVDGSAKPFILTSWTEGLNNDPWITNVGGATQARIRFTTYNSGTATIVFNGSVGVNAIRAYNLNANSFLTSSWLHDGAGNSLTSTLLSGKQALDVNIAGGVTINVALDHTTDNVLVYGNDGTTDRKIKTDASGNTQVVVTNFPATQAVTQSTSPWVVSGTVAATQSGTWNINNISGTISLPTGAATETTLAGIKTDTDKLTFASTRLLVDGSGVTQPVSGTITANAGTGTFTVGQATGTNLHAVIDSGSITVANATLAVTQSGTWNINNISGTISLPTGAATSAKQPALGSAGTPSADVLTVQGAVGMIALKVDGSGTTQPVSGTVTANIGTTNGLALDATVSALQVSQGSTTAGQKGGLTLGAVTAVAPSYTTAQSSPLSLTLAGALRIDGSATTQPVSGTVTANAGTGNFTVIQATGTNLHTVVDSGTVTVNQGTAGALSAAWPVSLSDGTNLLGTNVHPVRIDPTGTTTQPVSGTVTVNIGTTNGLALDATVAKLNIAQGASLASNTGPMIQGSVTTVAPTYVTGQISPLSLTTAGAVRVDGSGVTQPVSGTVTANQGGAPWSNNITQIAGSAIATAATGIAKVGLTDGTGNALTSSSGALNQNLSSVGTVSVAATSKGTQATNFIPVQMPNNTGRSYITFTANAVAGVAAETLLTFTTNKQGTATAGQTNYTPTSGKTLRITGIMINVLSGAGAGAWTRVLVRHNTAGATTTASPLVFVAGTGTTNANAVSYGDSFPVPEGLEIYGDGTQTIGISHISSATTAVESITVFGYEY